MPILASPVLEVEETPLWQRRRLAFLKLAESARRNEPGARADFEATLSHFERRPFFHTPPEVMDIIGLFYIPKDGASAALPMVVAASVLGCHDVLRFASASGREEIFFNERFLQRAYLVAGPQTLQSVEALVSSHRAQVKRLVEEGLRLAEGFRMETEYEPRWPEAYGLEHLLGETEIPSASIASWENLWGEAKRQVAAYYGAR
ncbi:MAG: hypothetical protein PW734_07225 [Verrucomicrobium sp.]|nr:hypothetical protein [Verrucomicrobium sp.]